MWNNSFNVISVTSELTPFFNWTELNWRQASLEISVHHGSDSCACIARVVDTCAKGKPEQEVAADNQLTDN